MGYTFSTLARAAQNTRERRCLTDSVANNWHTSIRLRMCLMLNIKNGIIYMTFALVLQSILQLHSNAILKFVAIVPDESVCSFCLLSRHFDARPTYVRFVRTQQYKIASRLFSLPQRNSVDGFLFFVCRLSSHSCYGSIAPERLALHAKRT